MKGKIKKEVKTWNETNSQIWEYVRDRKNEIIGILYAQKLVSDDKFGIGYALCSKTSKDDFNKTKMFEIAKGRAERTFELCFPFSMYDQAQIFINDRCKRYFKNLSPWQSIIFKIR